MASIHISDLSLGECEELINRLEDHMESLRIEICNRKVRETLVGPYSRAEIALTGRSNKPGFRGTTYYLNLRDPRSGALEKTEFTVDTHWRATNMGLRHERLYPLDVRYEDLDDADKVIFQAIHDKVLSYYVRDREQAFTDWLSILKTFSRRAAKIL